MTAAIALLAVYRSLTIGKSLVTRVYRTRAYWLAVLMVILAAFSVIPTDSPIENDISTALFFLFLIPLLIFINSNVLVAKEIDFFHKDILHWHSVYRPLLAVVIADSIIGLLVEVVFPNSPLALESGLGFLTYFALVGVAMSYSGVAMFVIARRTFDHTMRNFIRMLGFAVLSYTIFLTIWIPLDFIYPVLGDTVSTFAAIAAAYFFYKAAMSLSFVGKIAKEVA